MRLWDTLVLGIKLLGLYSNTLLFKQRSLLLCLNNFSGVGNLQTFRFISTFFVVYLHVERLSNLSRQYDFHYRTGSSGGEREKQLSPTP